MIKWNFTKFIVDKNGKVVARHGPTTQLEVIHTYYGFNCTVH